MNHSARGSDGGIVCCYRCLVLSDGFIVQLRTNTMNTYSICFMKALCSSYACVKCFPDLTRKKNLARRWFYVMRAMKVWNFFTVTCVWRLKINISVSKQPVANILYCYFNQQSSWHLEKRRVVNRGTRSFHALIGFATHCNNSCNALQ